MSHLTIGAMISKIVNSFSKILNKSAIFYYGAVGLLETFYGFAKSGFCSQLSRVRLWARTITNGISLLKPTLECAFYTL